MIVREIKCFDENGWECYHLYPITGQDPKSCAYNARKAIVRQYAEARWHSYEKENIEKIAKITVINPRGYKFEFSYNPMPINSTTVNTNI